jgi:predicted acetylornithine/succinylornithine family transaminase
MDSAERCLLNNYGKRSMVVTAGNGQHLTAADGREFLDFTAGIAVNCLGHSDPGWADVVSKQAKTLAHTSNMFLNVEQVALAESLVKLSFADKVYFCNSGTEANEAALKFARKFHFAKGAPRETFVSCEHSFHGRTMGSLALTGKESIKTPFVPMMQKVEFIKYNELCGRDAVNESICAINESTCAVFVEPVQGEGGVVPGKADFLRALRKRCDQVGALLVFDEVQCGLGRTGKLFAYEHSGVIPDMLSLAKPLAAGLPIGAVLMSDRVAACINPGDHGSTFAGNPLVCAAGNYTLGKVSEPAFLANVTSLGDRLLTGLDGIAKQYGLAARGLGLLCGVPFADKESCGAVVKAAQERGLLVLTAGGGDVLRVVPALNITASDIDRALEILQVCFDKVLGGVA